MELLKDNAVKSRFVKDFNLPIKVVRDLTINGVEYDSFDYYLNHLKNFYKTEESFNYFLDYIKNFQDREAYLDDIESLVEKVQNNFRTKKELTLFKEDDLRNYRYKLRDDIKKEKYLLNKNNGKEFISIDIKEANFQVMRLFNEDLVNKANNYQEFITQFSNKDYLTQSKRIRQIIFGDINLKPGKQQKIQKYIISNILDKLVNEKYLKKGSSVDITSDEIIIKKEDLLKRFDKQNLLEGELSSIDLRIEEFLLERLPTREKLNLNIFLKKENNKTSLKNCPTPFVSEVITFLKSNRNVNEYKKNLHVLDKVSFDNGRVSSYLDYLFD